MSARPHEEDDGLQDYEVECIGNVREVYQVRAASEEDAMARWFDGECSLQESSSVEPVSAKEVEL